MSGGGHASQSQQPSALLRPFLLLQVIRCSTLPWRAFYEGYAHPVAILKGHRGQDPAPECPLRGVCAPNGHFRRASGASPCHRSHSTRGWCTRWSQLNACHRIKAVTCSTSRCTNRAICLAEHPNSRLIFFARNPRSSAVRYRTPNLPNIE